VFEKEVTVSQFSADDRLAIHELLARYCRVIDFGLWDEFPSLFTPDCVIDFGELMGVHEGPEGVRRLAGMIGGTGLMMRHLVTNVIVDRPEAGRADVWCYVLALTGPDPTSLMLTTGRYEDEVVKRDGRWLIKRRRAVIETPR
jgi:3-phenylpropionate/cinnamic acid dioxygenase small subunit